MLVVNAVLIQFLLKPNSFWPFGNSCLETKVVIVCLAFGRKRITSQLTTNLEGLPLYGKKPLQQDSVSCFNIQHSF